MNLNYVAGSDYVTKVDLPADVFVDGLRGQTWNVQFLTNGNLDPSGGRIELIKSGTHIHVTQVTTQKYTELGTVTRIYATVASGIYRGGTANLYGISVQHRGSDGTMGSLERDPTILALAE